MVAARFLLVLSLAACAAPPLRPFSDRPVAWQEHDQESIAGTPAKTTFAKTRIAHHLLESVARMTDRQLAMSAAHHYPAEDVNALDEVPCSTWYCPRNHLGAPLALEAARRGPGVVPAPRPPLRIVSAKDGGAAVGFVVEDAAGRRYILKFDIPGHFGMHTGAEFVGSRLFHLLGYYVPDSYLLDLRVSDLAFGMKRFDLEKMLAPIPRGPDGRLRAVAIAYLPGKILGGFDFEGRRAGDPNDRIAHERRRAVRATRIFGAWINYGDVGPANTVDSVVEDEGRRFVRHYVVDFGTTLGSATPFPKSPMGGRERAWSVRRDLVAFMTFGAHQRDWQKERSAAERAWGRLPSVGYFPYENFDPEEFRSNYPYRAHEDLTDRDAYWSAKVVTAVTDAQIDAIVEDAGYSPPARAYLAKALRERRDTIGRRYLTRVTAVEHPRVEGNLLCFDDLVLERGYARPQEVSYTVRFLDEQGRNRARTIRAHPRSASGCLPVLANAAALPYRVVELQARLAGREAKAARIHLKWRPAEGRFVVVGLERDE